MPLYSIFLFLGALLGILAFFRTSKLKKRVFDLELKLNQFIAPQAKAKQKKEDEPSDSAAQYPLYKPAALNQDIQQILSPPKQPIPSLTPVPATRESIHVWEAIAPEKLSIAMGWFKENWAGFFGVTILVLGISFAAAYAGYFATPFIRFLMVLSAGLLLLVGALMLRKKALWQELSSWLQSASGAVVLLAMIGSQYFQALQFYHDPQIGLFLLSLGLIYNVLLAYFSPKQLQASLHVLISLCVLLMVPKNLAVFVVATIVALSSIGLSIRNTWNSNLVLTYLAFTIFHYSWFSAQTNIQAVALYGIIGISIVGACALLVHYRKIYQAIEVKNNLFAHISIWVLLGSQYLLYNFGFKYLFVPLGLAAIASLTSALYAKKHHIQWLFTCDTIVAQLLALFAITSLTRIEFRREFITWIATIESLTFATVAFCTRQKLISIFGLLFVSFSFIALCVSLLIMPLSIQESLWLILGTLVPFYGVRWHLAKRELIDNQVSDFDDYNYLFPFVLDLLMFILGIFYIKVTLVHPKLGYVALMVVLLGLALNKKVIHNEGHKGLYLLFLLAAMLFGWFKIAITAEFHQALLYYCLPMTILLFSLLWLKIFYFNQDQHSIEDQWVYLLGLHVGISAYLILSPMSEYLPGISYLIFAIGFFEIATILGNHPHSSRKMFLATANKNGALLFLLSYCVLYVMLYLQSEATIFAYLSMNDVLSMIVVVISGYWYYSTPLAVNQYPALSNRASVAVQPLTQALPFDIAIIMALMLLISAFSAPIHPIGYGLIALILAMPIFQRHFPPRAGVYAVILLFAMCVQVAVVSSTWASPLSNWYQTTHITGPFSLLIGMLVAMCLLKKSTMNSENKLLKLYDSSPILLGFLPIFTSFAFFLAWRFDKAFLTMLWVIEIVSMVILGYYLKSKKLVHIAFAFLILCVLRLIFYDLGQTDLLIRAIVFVIVGLLMILIHMIYKKYANRLT